MSTRRAYLSLGGNLGQRQAYLSAALAGLVACGQVQVAAKSSLYETAPWGPVPQADFLNACLALDTQLSPEALLDLCQALETTAERKRTLRWGPRTLDVDLLWYAGETRNTPRLILPHPRLTQRRFVLLPLAEVAGPELPMAAWLSACGDQGEVRRLAGPADW